MSRFVICDGGPFAIIPQLGQRLSEHDLVEGLVEIIPGHGTAPVACCEQCRLVAQIGEVGSTQADGTPRNNRQIHVLRQADAPCVDFHDVLPGFAIRQPHNNLPVEAARTQQSRIQDLVPLVKAIHLHEQLV